MLNKKSNFVERRLYEYALHAVCSPLRVIDTNISSDNLAAHVAKLFNVDPDEHEDKYMRAFQIQPCPVMLTVYVKKARDLPGEDQNGLSDPYCKVSVIYKPNALNESNGPTILQTPPASPSPMKRTSSLFSCASAPSGKHGTKQSTSFFDRKTSKRRHSVDRLQKNLNEKKRIASMISYRTEIRPKTVNPEWNEHFDFEIENVAEQQLQLIVFDSDRGQELGMKTVVQQKRGFTKKIQGIRTFFSTGQIEDDFLGQLTLDIKSLASYNGERWFPLTSSTQTRSTNSKSRGEILLGLKVHFKLDDTKSKDRRRISNDSVLEFRRRHSTLESGNHASSSIILRPSIFRTNLRPSALQVQDYSRANIFEDDLTAQLNRSDSCLTPATDADSPLLIEEYHQLYRIVILHQLEDERELKKNEPNGITIDWDGSLNELSYNVLIQFRVLYNIPLLSESLIQLLVIMELRCSPDYALFISQGVIEAYLKPFMDNVRQKNDINHLDFTDYEKTVFKEILYLFIDHYKRRVHTDAPWFLPSTEYLPNIQSIFETICTLLQLKMCTNETLIKTHLEETIKARLRTDINDYFTVKPFSFDNKDDIQMSQIKEYLEFVTKITRSMSALPEYQKHFMVFNVNYVKSCFFETHGAADRLSEVIECLLKTMTEYFQAYLKPMVQATSSIYDPNVIQSSSLLLYLYSYIRLIVGEIRKNLETRDWQTNAFKLKLNDYNQWFAPIMYYLLEGFVAQIRQAMERALEDDNDVLPEDDIVLHSRSSFAASNLCIKLCKEWESIEYPDIIVRYTALVKLTNTICEQCQHYARRTNRKLKENRYFTDLNRTRSFNISRKLCMLVNDIEYVKQQVLSSLPSHLNFSGVIEKVIENYGDENFKQLRKTLERLISTAEQEMTDVIKLIFDHVAELVQVTLKNKITIYYGDERRGKANCMDDVNRYIDKEILENLYEGLEHVLYSRVACAIRIKVIQCLQDLLPMNEPTDFYKRVLSSFNQLVVYLDGVCREESNKPSPPCDEITAFERKLKTCALTTEQLQLSYFREICQIHSPHEYTTNNGEIVFRAAHENRDGLITIYVYIVGCRNLPKMDLIGASDPYVILELLPASIYRKPLEKYRTSVKRRRLDPEFNEPFQWQRLPTNVLHERGAVLRLSVWDKDVFSYDDFIGECFVSLPNIPSLKNLASLRDVPVTEMRLRRPQKANQPTSFELIKKRVQFDEEAALFYKQRSLVMKSGTTSDGASVRSGDRKSSGLIHSKKNNTKSPIDELYQTIEKNPSYRLWNIISMKGQSANTSLDTNDENVDY